MTQRSFIVRRETVELTDVTIISGPSITSDVLNTSGVTEALAISTNLITANGTNTDIDIDLTPKGAGRDILPRAEIDEGFIDNVILGGTTPVQVTATTALATQEIGYTTGAGGTVTQNTSKSTGVTLNKTTGEITMNNAALNAQESVAFTLTNSTIDATDVIAVSIKSGGTSGAYIVGVSAAASGSCEINLFNTQTTGALSEAVVLSFAVIKGVTS
jgi:hypothetical protein